LKDKLEIISYVQLMKPAIMLLVLVTGSASLVLEKSTLLMPWPIGIIRFSLALLGLMLTGGSANAFNMYFERKVDGQMARTRNRRPLPLGKIQPQNALIFAFVIGLSGVLLFARFFNMLSAILSLVTILFYSLFYTLILKPRTSYNIVIGGIAGAMAPVIAWAAVSGHIAVAPIILSAIIFLWTPPHFWALAIYHKNDYESVNYPMMPVARGIKAAKQQILSYVLVLVAVSGFCFYIGSGLFYGIAAIILGSIFISKTVQFVRSKSIDMAIGLFEFSIVYLLALFAGLIIDATLKLLI
jgi:protoheme IX farnesyltransferase